MRKCVGDSGTTAGKPRGWRLRPMGMLPIAPYGPLLLIGLLLSFTGT